VGARYAGGPSIAAIVALDPVADPVPITTSADDSPRRDELPLGSDLLTFSTPSGS
jgi:hypothetical protein